MANFLLELMSEEMPASLIANSASSIEYLFINGFKKNNISFKENKLFYSPKRLTFIFNNLKYEKNETIIKGPSLKAPQKAIDGFVNSNKFLKSQFGSF